MTRIEWRFVGALSKALGPEEREAVCGDIAERGDGFARAVVSVIGLVARRQAPLWRGWRPWFALIVLVVPLGVLLSLVSVRSARGVAVPAWMIAHNWTPTYLETPWARTLVLNQSLSALEVSVSLACWSWAAGVLMGATARRANVSLALLFGFVVLLARLTSSFGRAGTSIPESAEAAKLFYDLAFPLVVQAGLVVAPMVWGMRQGRRIGDETLGLRSVLLCLAFATVLPFATRQWGIVLCSWGTMDQCQSWYQSLRDTPLRLAPTVFGPIVYVVAAKIWRRRYGRVRTA